jgi:RecA-family ATPase
MPETLYIIDKLVVENGGTLISGKPHAMKSLSALAGCLEVLVKKTFWGLRGEKISRVAYLETEDPRGVVEMRVRELSKGLGIDPANAPQGFHLFCTGHLDLGSEMVRRDMFEHLREYRPDLIVLSTLQGMLGTRSWNKQEDMAPILSLIVRLCLEVCPVILITHSPQDSTQERAIGTISQAANFIVTGHMTKRTDGSVTDLRLDSKLGDKTSFTLKLQTEGKELRGFATQKTSIVRADILSLRATNPDLSAEKIAEQLGCTRQYVYKVLGDVEESDDL